MHCQMVAPLLAALAVTVTVTLAAGAGLAEPLTGIAARGLLYDADGAQVQIIKGGPLDEDEAALVAMVVADQPYFGAVAVAPDEKLLESRATIAVANFHSTEAAMAEALRQCDALRQSRSACVIAALIRPAGWQASALSLSSEATRGFAEQYPPAAGAMAISGATGAWAIASGTDAADAALLACGAKDCAVVVAD